jgi:hypothetical protein
MNTNELIDDLARRLTPAAPLWPPNRRAAAWSLGAVLYLGVVVTAMALFTSRAGGAGAGFWASQIAAVVVGLLATRAAFVSVVPGLSTRSTLWAALAGFVWLGTLVGAAPPDFDWVNVFGASQEWICVGFIMVAGAPLIWILFAMLRRGAALSPWQTAALASLAAGVLANVGACMSLPHANSAITFAWHGSVVVALMLAAALSGRLLLPWRAGAPRPD